MILHTNETPIYSSGDLTHQEFKISASGKAFKILSANLYQNKIRAFIRELSANAYDAHIAAGHPEKQFDVHLPSAIDPMFWIRDYGIGLSKESVLSLYTTYFESTKSESNDFVGALGLGSKSPFAYVDSFNVTSYFNGSIILYDMSIKNGVPNVSIMYEGDTDEPNGMKIALSVNSGDYERVVGEARYVYGTFKTKPNFIGRSMDCELTAVTQGDGYFTSNDGTRYSGVFAIMGNIAYPVSNGIKLGNVISNFSNQRSVFLEFNLGDLDITPSREELSYDPQTEKFLQDRIDQIGQTILQDSLDKYDGETCPRETYKAINTNEPYGLRSEIMKNVMIEGKSITDWNQWFNWENSINRIGRIKYRRIDRVGTEIKSTWIGSRSWGPNSSKNLSAIDRLSSELPVIFINDDDKSYLQTIRALIKADKVPTDRTMFVFKSSCPNERQIMDNLIEKCRGDAIVVKNSDHTELRKTYMKTKAASGVKAAPRGKLVNSEKFTLRPEGSVSVTTCSYYADEVDNFEGLYAFKFFDSYVDAHEVEVLNRAIIADFMRSTDTKEIMIVRKNHWARAEKNPNARHVVDAVRELVASSSPKQVARKFGCKMHTFPAWIKNTVAIDDSYGKMFLPNTRHTNKHKLYDLFDECAKCTAFIRQSGKDINVIIDKFVGHRRRITTASGSHFATAAAKYPMLYKVMSNAYSTIDQRNYAPEVRKILK